MDIDIDRLPDMLRPGDISFSVYTVDKLELLDDTSKKMVMILHPVNMAIGTEGKNDHLAKESIGVMNVWALRELSVACAKVAYWCIIELMKRHLGR